MNFHSDPSVSACWASETIVAPALQWNYRPNSTFGDPNQIKCILIEWYFVFQFYIFVALTFKWKKTPLGIRWILFVDKSSSCSPSCPRKFSFVSTEILLFDKSGGKYFILFYWEFFLEYIFEYIPRIRKSWHPQKEFLPIAGTCESVIRMTFSFKNEPKIGPMVMLFRCPRITNTSTFLSIDRIGTLVNSPVWTRNSFVLYSGNVWTKLENVKWNWSEIMKLKIDENVIVSF